MIPLRSNFLRDTAEKKLDYYKTFLKSKPQFEVREENINLDGCNQVQYNGIYDISETDEETGEVVVTPARFSFTFQTFDGKYWAIKAYHSSKFPNEDSRDPLNADSSVVENDSSSEPENEMKAVVVPEPVHEKSPSKLHKSAAAKH